MRNRAGAALFAALWDIALEPAPSSEGHNGKLNDGRLARLLGAHFRRKNAVNGAIGYRFAQHEHDESDANFVTFHHAARTPA